MLHGLGIEKRHFDALKALRKLGGSATAEQLRQARIKVRYFAPLVRIGLVRKTDGGHELTETANAYFKKRRTITLGEKHDLAIQSMAANKGWRTSIELSRAWVPSLERVAKKFGLAADLPLKVVETQMSELEDLDIVKRTAAGYELSPAALEMALESRARVIAATSRAPKTRGRRRQTI